MRLLENETVGVDCYVEGGELLIIQRTEVEWVPSYFCVFVVIGGLQVVAIASVMVMINPFV